MASVSLTASGIDFSDYQTVGSGSMSSELLDHQEEGTFTATFRFGGVSGTSHGTGTGQYRKVGAIVGYDWYVSLNNTTQGGGGHAYMTGFPFAVGTGMDGCPYTNDKVDNFEHISARATGTGPGVALYKHPTNNGENLTSFNDTNWGANVAGKGVGVTGIYFV